MKSTMKVLRNSLKKLLDRIFRRNLIHENHQKLDDLARSIQVLDDRIDKSHSAEIADIKNIKGELSDIKKFIRDFFIDEFSLLINDIDEIKRKEEILHSTKQLSEGIIEYAKSIDSRSKRIISLIEQSDGVTEKIDELSSIVREFDSSLRKKIDVAVHDFRTIGRNEFRQAEASTNLTALLGDDFFLPTTRGWAGSPDFLLHIYRHILENKPKLVVELGSGVSTLVIASALKRTGSGKLISLDHLEQFALETERNLKQRDLSDLAQVVIAPLSEWSPSQATSLGNVWNWYSVPALSIDPETIDLLVVDGPPAISGKYARYPALPYFFDQIADGGYVLLDDMVRSDEKTAADAWAQEFGLSLKILKDYEKGLAVLQKLHMVQANKDPLKSD